MTRSVLQAATHGGLLVADTRGWRLLAGSGGSVVEHRPDGSTRTVAEAGQVDRVVLVRGADLARRLGGGRARGDAISLLTDDAVALTVPLTSVHLGIETFDTDLMRATSGAADFALAIGRTLEIATPDEIARVNAARGAFTRGPSSDGMRRVRILHVGLLLLAAVGFVLSVAADDDHRRQVQLATIVLIAPLAVVAASLLRLSGTFVGQRPPPPDGRAVVPNVLPADRWLWLRESQLQIGADDVVHTEHARETWLPGPRRGGVVTCVIAPGAIWFLDRHGVTLGVVMAERWITPGGSAEALELACAGAGIAVDFHSTGDVPPTLQADVDPAVYASSQALLYLQPPLERGVPVPAESWVVGFLGFTVGAGSLALQVADGVDPVDIVYCIVGLTIAVSQIVVTMRFRRWNNRQMSTDTTGTRS
ncbi:hypothetical protein [Aeromicrobium fastidiosum]|uniref:Uncharacterized protein n=1 Tax=Aeromicrobium fastidiosum TaxID=52699 RepID=A0A641AM01_9ACTN|nr:hypothetical protein [Aeromicrobium fastidiosum]KAA1378298.1 hypothetical protein ESP62_007945 [Aeromicrobium fastidiosum]MBP2388882.1 hypothetical protein [Aeromicrobium fastidiosum]